MNFVLGLTLASLSLASCHKQDLLTQNHENKLKSESSEKERLTLKK